MNRIQKAATAFVALTITVVGATLATAPMSLVYVRPGALQHGMSAIARNAMASLGTPSSSRQS